MMEIVKGEWIDACQVEDETGAVFRRVGGSGQWEIWLDEKWVWIDKSKPDGAYDIAHLDEAFHRWVNPKYKAMKEATDASPQPL